MRLKRDVLTDLNSGCRSCCDRHADYQACSCLKDAVFAEGDEVYKVTGDYAFAGVVVAAFAKRGGARRYVVENADGLLHIFNGDQLMLRGFDARGRANEQRVTLA